MFVFIAVFFIFLVRERRVELLRPKTLDPEPSASTNSATLAPELLD